MNSLERLVNFSDAVMAIAVTLLVLPLTERAATARVNSFSAFASDYGHLILIFFLSFVVICRYWEVHHNVMKSLCTFNTALFWLNAFWLLSIALIPFTSELLGNDAQNGAFINAIYIGSLALTAYLGFGIQWLVGRSPNLQKPSGAKTDAAYGLASAIGMSLALLVAIVDPAIGEWSLLLLIPAGYAARFVRQRS